uniref:NB-ARC domain-containing protein n=1 Tax=Chenopodium quinoa TaxID=63459 RepID=A0A803MI58_CHEQI
MQTQAADNVSVSGNPNPGTDVETSDYKQIQESIIVGRESDIESIVNALLDTSNLENDIFDVAIVGKGAIGKTTLAKLVYTDKIVVDHFDLRAADLNTRNFELPPLSEHDSFYLFSRIAFGQQKPSEHLIQLAKKYLHHCGGIPLAVVALASVLHATDEDEWEDFFASLERVEKYEFRDNHPTFKIIKQRYSHYPSPLKACFS